MSETAVGEIKENEPTTVASRSALARLRELASNIVPIAATFTATVATLISSDSITFTPAGLLGQGSAIGLTALAGFISCREQRLYKQKK